MKVVYPAVFHEEDGGWWVEFPDLPGCVTQGDTEAEAYRNASEALELFLQDDYAADALPKPSSATEFAHDGAFVSLVCGDFAASRKVAEKELTL